MKVPREKKKKKKVTVSIRKIFLRRLIKKVFFSLSSSSSSDLFAFRISHFDPFFFLSFFLGVLVLSFFVFFSFFRPFFFVSGSSAQSALRLFALCLLAPYSELVPPTTEMIHGKSVGCSRVLECSS